MQRACIVAEISHKAIELVLEPVARRRYASYLIQAALIVRLQAPKLSVARGATVKQSFPYMAPKKKYNLDKPPAVVIGVCGHGLAVLRALTGHGIPIIALEADPSLPGIHTRLATVELVADINGPSLMASRYPHL